ncbi:transcriptional regulator [Kitasatospora sp. NPDC097643]|uniref:transcriptional regulator n=1 Tax=Kitasatospora sp. NPDC097643 TaxID=3157230 RepID=UPI00332F06A1
MDSKRGMAARLKYLTERKGGADAMQRAGLSPSRETMRRWLKGTQQPGPANRHKIESAYRDLRSKNVARTMKARLSKDGRGTRVSVTPLPASAVPTNKQTRQGQFEDREMTIRPGDWNRAVDLWANDDMSGLEEWWMDIAGDLGSPPEAYFEVAHIGFSA